MVSRTAKLPSEVPHCPMKTHLLPLLLLLPSSMMAQEYLKQFPRHQETKYFD